VSVEDIGTKNSLGLREGKEGQSCDERLRQHFGWCVQVANVKVANVLDGEGGEKVENTRSVSYWRRIYCKVS